ncbi:transmembrane protein, putative (macronuclear) [Tetrahymena thermophila SB210]|uniref:Transmembrane protein, putative n=1 Tax=Tetrahymena thermophila (strain SB210) TaxID=312017 RepID=W7X3H0_TETTS|nr:transmembrane protein, putative [Tetrahymena thermophila SB210]EWS73840.1 transmembrane protein, putative [Tetrahymena thermophila SB210]|eukprot:XP_012653587.1 transmembrane protein, putative [Tetrahymena thermophila SB210]
MALLGKKFKIKFTANTLIVLQLYTLIITIFYLNGYPVLEMIYCLPIIAFLQLVQYLLFWNSHKNCLKPFLILNICFFFISLCLFLGIFLGIFNKTLKYHFQEIQECSVIGKFSINFEEFPSLSSEKYSILYIDFQMDGQKFLGYGCLSSESKDTTPTSYQQHNPLTFLYYGEQQCFQGQCSIPYKFSQVKLPSWMCLPFDTYYEDLVQTKNCYVHFFNSSIEKGQPKDQAYLNSKNRINVRDLEQFALISFNKLNAPFSQYFAFLVFTFCPLISSLNVLFIGLIEYLDQYIKDITYKNKKLNNINQFKRTIKGRV